MLCPAPTVRSASTGESLALEPGEQTGSERLAAWATPGPGDNTTPNNVQDLQDKAFYSGICCSWNGTNTGLRQVVADCVRLDVSLGDKPYVKQTVWVTNLEDEVASMGFYLARTGGNVVVGEEHKFGEFELKRYVKRKEETHTGSIADTEDDCTFTRILKVPPYRQVSWTFETLLSDFEWAPLVSDETPGWFADVALLLPIVPLGSVVPTTVSVKLQRGRTLVLPGKDEATGDAVAIGADVVLWAEGAGTYFYPFGLSCATLFQCRVLARLSPFVDAQLQALALHDEAAAETASAVTSVRSPALPVGFDDQTGAPKFASLVDVCVPLGLPSPGKPNDVAFFLVVDESCSMYAKSGTDEMTNLEMAKRSAVAILTAFLQDVVPLLRRRGVLSQQQRVFFSVLMFHHQCRTVVSLQRVDPASDLTGCCDAIMASAASGGTNFCSFVAEMKEHCRHMLDALVVACVLTDGGANDIDAFMDELGQLRRLVAGLRVVVVGYGAWVCERTALRMQTDGCVLLATGDDERVKEHAMRLVSLAVVAAVRDPVNLEFDETLLAAVRTDDPTKGLSLMTTMPDDDPGRLVVSTQSEPGATLRLLYCHQAGQGAQAWCNGAAVEPFEALAGEVDPLGVPLNVLQMLDPLYLRASVKLVPTGARERRRIVTSIGLNFSLSTTYTEPISTLELPDSIATTMVAPAAANRPVHAPLWKMIIPCAVVDTRGHRMYRDTCSLLVGVPIPGAPAASGGPLSFTRLTRSLGAGCALTREAAGDDAGCPKAPPGAKTWIEYAKGHAERVSPSALASRLSDALDAIEASSSAKRERIKEEPMAAIDEACAMQLRHPLNAYPVSAPPFDMARACYHMLCIIYGKQPVSAVKLVTTAQIRAAAHFVPLRPA